MIRRIAEAEPGLPAVARRWVSVAALISWAGTLGEVQRGPHALGAAWVALGSIAYVVSIVLWARGRRGGVLGGLSAFALLALLVWIEAMPGERHGKHLPAIVLLASSIADLAGRPQRAIEASAGAVGGVYVSAGLSKLVVGGAGWLAPGALSMLIAERYVAAPEPLASLRHFVGLSPRLSSALALFALVAELGGIGWVVPRWRRAMAALAFAMHVGIALLLGFVYVEWMLVLVGLAAASPPLFAAREGSSTRSAVAPP